MQWRKTDDAIEVSIGTNEDDGIFEPFSTPFYISKVVSEFDNGDESIEIVLEGLFAGPKYLHVSSDAVGPGIVKKMKAKGFELLDNAENNEIVEAILLETKRQAPHSCVHRRLGFTEGEELMFFAHHPIDSRGVKKISTFVEPQKTKVHGSYREWYRLMRREVLGRPKLELALALSALAPVAHLLRISGEITDIPMAALVGSSSIGKTTALRIIASVYGSVSVGGGIITNMNTTQNGIYARLAANFAYPAIFDEVTGMAGLDMTSMIYYMPNGFDKLRCNPDGSLREPIKFSGAIFFSSERSLFGRTIKTEGLKARLVEMPFLWTASRENAENLERGLHRNYGSAVYPLIKWLLRRQQWLVDRFKAEYKQMLDEFAKLGAQQSNVSNRVIKIYAEIIVAAEVVSIAFNFPLAVDEIRKMLLRNLLSNPVAFITPEDEFEAVKRFVLDNLSKFPRETEHHALISSAWGVRKRDKGKEELWMIEKVFEEQIDKITKRNISSVISDFVDNKWLYKDNQRHLTFKTKIAGVESKCYRLNIKELSENEDVNSKKNTKQKSPYHKDLLS